MSATPDLGFIVWDRLRLRELAKAAERASEPYEGFRILRPLTAAERVRAQYDAARAQVTEATR